jgi:hypothetical protein
MTRNYIFVVLPEYPDEKNATTAEVFQMKELPAEEQVDEWMKQLVAFLDFFKEEECELLYDGKNLRSCIYVLDTLKDSYPNRSTELLMALRGYSNWREHRVSCADQQYEIYHAKVNDEVRTEVAERRMASTADFCLIAVHISGYVQKDWEVKKGELVAQVSSRPLHVPEVFSWLAQHRGRVRVYNWNPKHGEHGVGAHVANKGDEVSVLLCSKEHAQELLQEAVGTKYWDRLWAYDPEYGKFMEFPAETKYAQLPDDAETRSYHSYHVDNSEDIPKDVLKRLRLTGNIPEK